MQPQLMTSTKDNWETPIWLFKELDNIFNFQIDSTASDTNCLCDSYFTEADNALIQMWGDGSGHNIYCNPPYGNGVLLNWVKKFVNEFTRGNTIVALVAARTETKWFRLIWDHARYVIFLYGRLKFLLEGKEIGVAIFPSAIPIFTDRDWELTSLEKYGKIIRLR